MQDQDHTRSTDSLRQETAQHGRSTKPDLDRTCRFCDRVHTRAFQCGQAPKCLACWDRENHGHTCREDAYAVTTIVERFSLTPEGERLADAVIAARGRNGRWIRVKMPC